MTRQQFYSEIYDTQGLKASRSVHLVNIWIEFYGGTIDYDNTMVFASKEDANEYLDRCLERLFGTTDVYSHSRRDSFIGYYEIPVGGNGGAPKDYFPEEIRGSVRAVCFSIVNAPVCKY